MVRESGPTEQTGIEVVGECTRRMLTQALFLEYVLDPFVRLSSIVNSSRDVVGTILFRHLRALTRH